jgi:hypothetical protein
VLLLALPVKLAEAIPGLRELIGGWIWVLLPVYCYVIACLLALFIRRVKASVAKVL